MSDPPAVWAFKASNGNLLSLSGSDLALTDWAKVKPEEKDKYYFSQLWMVEPVANSSPQTYTIRSLASGTVLQVAENWSYGNNINGHDVLGSSDQWGVWNNQQWIFESVGTDKWKVTNLAKSTVMEMYQGSSYDQQWVGASNPTSSHDQVWTLERRSRGSGEIFNMLNSHAKIDSNAFRHYAADGVYVNLPAAVRQEIWDESRLGWKDGLLRDYPWREEIFDCDDFAIVFKAMVALWGAKNLKANKFSLVMGICWGSKKELTGIHAAHAFNWYLTPDSNDITFYEPQRGSQEDDAMGYDIYFGNY